MSMIERAATSCRYAKIVFFLGCIAAAECSGQYSTVRNQGLDVAYRVFGDGSPVLILGGGPGDASCRYLSLAQGIGRKRMAILVDQRGTGRSIPVACDSSTISIAMTLDDFEAIRTHLAIKTWIVLGFSYGGYLASLYAEYYPRSVSSLILLDSPGLTLDGHPFFWDNISARLRPSDEDVYEYWNDSTRKAQNPQHAMVEQIRAIVPGYFFDRKKSLAVTQTMKDGDFNFALGSCIELDIKRRGLDLAKTGVGFKNPVLILHGRQDPLGESIPQLLSRSYTKSTLVFVERSGHYSWMEQPEEVFSTIEEFILRHTPPH